MVFRGTFVWGGAAASIFLAVKNNVLLKEVLAQVECAAGAAVAGALCSCL